MYVLPSRDAEYLRLIECLESKNIQPERFLKRNILPDAERTLDVFFKQHENPIDIVFILESGLHALPEIKEYLHGNNVAVYRPEATHNDQKPDPFFIGEQNPGNLLLLVDDDMAGSKVVFEASGVFGKYEIIYMYLAFGYGGRDDPLLTRIEELQKTPRIE